MEAEAAMATKTISSLLVGEVRADGIFVRGNM